MSAHLSRRAKSSVFMARIGMSMVKMDNKKLKEMIDLF
jgi:hypothetical protein